MNGFLDEKKRLFSTAVPSILGLPSWAAAGLRFYVSLGPRLCVVV